MLLKKIILDNIRSYEHEEVEFSEGSLLLSGDIGSGKTSVLLGIEFALFGLQPGQRGSALLRNGKKHGGVVMEFEVDGKNIIIERTLEKKKTISQNYCAITVDGNKKEMSVTELKSQILGILNYPEEFSKKQNTLYKFTVYTPQEEMKQIILQDPETRVNTLRHVFGIDKYKRVLENISLLSAKIREEKRLKEGMIESLEENKLTLVSKEKDIELKNSSLLLIERELFSKTEKRRQLQEELQEISKKIEEKNKFQQEIEKTRIMLLNKKESFIENMSMSESLKEQIKEFQKLKFEESEIHELEKKLESTKKKKELINEKSIQIASWISSLNLKIEDSRKLEKKISSLEICPTCLQDVDAVYRANVLNKLHSEIYESSKKLEQFEGERKSVLEENSAINLEISGIEKKIQELNLIKIKKSGIQEKEKRLEEIEKSISLLEKDISLLSQQEKLLQESVSGLEKFSRIFERVQEQLENASREERKVEINVAELKKEIELFSDQIEEIKEKIKNAEAIKSQMDYLSRLEDWLSKKFASMISFIEKNVMFKLKTEFSKLFSEWFYMLVSDSFNVDLLDDFTPRIEQQDYELDYSYLSGGERTAIALAYRLALNQVINSFLSRIKTKDILILDEPTDGFSEQQLDKMRDVLQQLNAKQLIIVSHEQKIESFVDKVIRFRKVNGVSRRE